MVKKSRITCIIVVFSLILVNFLTVASQEASKKGMVVENAPSAIPCDSIQHNTPQAKSNDAKGLFYDPNSGSLISPKKLDSKPRTRSQSKNGAKSKLQPTSNHATANTGLKYWIELIKPNGQTERVAKERTFRSGERIRFHFESNVDGYVAMTLVDAYCNAKTLFPTSSIRGGNNFIQHSKDYILPSDEAWFRFDEEAGMERIMVFFSKSRQSIDSLQLKPSMDSNSVVMLTNKAREDSKGIFIELEDKETTSNKPTAYYVNPVSDPKSYVVVEIILNHAP